MILYRYKYKVEILDFHPSMQYILDYQNGKKFVFKTLFLDSFKTIHSYNFFVQTTKYQMQNFPIIIP